MSAPEHTATAQVRAAIAALGREPAWIDPSSVIGALHQAALLLSDARDPLARDLRHALHRETGLSLAMIEWGLLTSLSSMRHAPLAELAGFVPAAAPRELIGVVLAGNVFVAALRGLALPLLAGARVIAKTASREGAFAHALHAALARTEPAVAARLSIVEFGREDHEATEWLCTSVDALSVYGSDETVAELRARWPSTRVIAHGHGLSAGYVAQSALSSAEQAARTAERVALDICAYDQHGCLSPHFVLVEPGGALDPRAFAQLLAAESLPALAQLLPAGAPALQEQADQLQWRATAAVRGELFASADHSVSCEPSPLRPSPGGRQIGVYACAGPNQLRELLEPFGRHLKCVGVAGSKAERAVVAAELRGFSTAQVCRSGEMQSPPFDAWADGAPPLAGFV